MALSKAYTEAYGKLGEFFGKLRDGQAPERFTHQLLKDMGFKSNKHRAYIPLLKALGFLTPDGKTTSIYNDYRDHSKSKQIMGQALKEAYADIFLIKEKPTASDYSAIEGKFKSYHNVSDNVALNMRRTFYSLLALADLSGKRKKVQKQPEIQKEISPDSQNDPTDIVVPNGGPSLNYNIQIHLPPTKDIEVYNAIFKSLKEHLF